MRMVGACVILCTLSLCAARSSNAQDMAEAARQEKARKAAKQKPPAHVYTNEDLQRSQILMPEDRAHIEARKKNVTLPPADENSPAIAPSQDTQQATSSESLGEIARRLRAEKVARQGEQARKLPQPAPFKLDLPHDAVLAHPKPPARPLLAPSTVPSSFPRIVKPSVNSGAVKHDPFSRAIIPAPPRSVISTPSLKSVAPPPSARSTADAVPGVAPPIVVPPTTIHPSPVNSKHRPDSVRVQTGDSLWNLSRQYLGKGSRWQEWLTRNPGMGDPRGLQPGAVLLVPLAEAAVAAAPADSPSRLVPDEVAPATKISVQPGDSLWRIAAAHLGSGADWPCLAQANPDLGDVSLIYPGQTLVLPASCAATKQVSRRN
jgi:nucleoid-associated protein YgaU